jgi:hypothetical protein
MVPLILLLQSFQFTAFLCTFRVTQSNTEEWACMSDFRMAERALGLEGSERSAEHFRSRFHLTGASDGRT